MRPVYIFMAGMVLFAIVVLATVAVMEAQVTQAHIHRLTHDR